MFHPDIDYLVAIVSIKKGKRQLSSNATHIISAAPYWKASVSFHRESSTYHECIFFTFPCFFNLIFLVSVCAVLTDFYVIEFDAQIVCYPLVALMVVVVVFFTALLFMPTRRQKTMTMK